MLYLILRVQIVRFKPDSFPNSVVIFQDIIIHDEAVQNISRRCSLCNILWKVEIYLDAVGRLECHWFAFSDINAGTKILDYLWALLWWFLEFSFCCSCWGEKELWCNSLHIAKYLHILQLSSCLKIAAEHCKSNNLANADIMNWK